MSAAGQNETVLGCRGLAQVMVGVARCWASLFSHLSVEYRRQRGQHVRSSMAVVVQQMVTAEVSGVMFTRDPATGDPSQLTLAASYGLGEVGDPIRNCARLTAQLNLQHFSRSVMKSL